LVKRPKVRLNVRFFAAQLAHGQVELQPLLFFLFSLKGEFNEGRTLHSYLPISYILICRKLALLFAVYKRMVNVKERVPKSTFSFLSPPQRITVNPTLSIIHSPIL
jgi:hypothetical protein